MVSELRKTGISVVADVPWGSHFCHFYETKQDLLDTLLPYFKAGLESNEFCVWVVNDPLSVEEVMRALRKTVPDLDEHLLNGDIEILDALEWYLTENVFSLERVTNAWDQKLEQALARGYDGMRVSGDTYWLRENDWRDFCAYEKQLNESITDRRMSVLCSYPLTNSRAAQILDVMEVHQFAIARRQGEWEVIQSPEPIQARAEIRRLNEELRRVPDRTPNRHAMLRYGIAVLSVIAALLIARWMDIHLVSAPASLFLCAIMFSAWYGGVKPGLLAMVLSLLAFKYYFLSPIYSLSLDMNEIARLVIFVMAGFLVGSVSAAQWKTAESLKRARDVLFGTVQELKRTNVALRTENAERKRAEDAVRHSEERLRFVIDTVPALIHTGLPDGFLDFFNQRWLNYVGLSLDDLLGWKWTAAIHPDDVAAMVDRWRAALAKGEPFEHEARVRRADGEYRWMFHRKVPLRDERGNIVKWYGSSIDIEDRKRADDALRRSEDRIRMIIDTIPVMAWSTRPDGVVDFLNQRWMNYAGLTMEQYIEDPTGPIHPEDVDRIMAKWRWAMAAGETYEDEMRLRRADGEYRWFLVLTEPLRDDQGNVVKWYGSSIDIDDRKRTEEKLKHSEVQQAQAQRLAHVGSWDWDLRTNDVTWSDELYRIRGIQPGEIKAAGDAVSLIHPDDRESVWNTIQRAISNKAPYNFYYRVLRPDGAERIVHSRGLVDCDEQGEPIRIFGATQDVTEFKRAEEKLKETSEQLRALSARVQSAREEEAARIARELHDELGSALTSVKWDLELISTLCSESAGRQDLSNLHNKTEHMIVVIDSTINTVRRIASDLRPSILDDLGLLAAIEWQAKQFESRSGIICKVDSLVDNLQINQEQSTAIFRILQEALTNVLRHSQASKVNIVIEVKEGEFVLEVRDNGRGILEGEITGSYSLGLIGMQERAQLLGGMIEIEGTGGEGTVLKLRVPIQSQTSE